MDIDPEDLVNRTLESFKTPSAAAGSEPKEILEVRQKRYNDRRKISIIRVFEAMMQQKVNQKRSKSWATATGFYPQGGKQAVNQSVTEQNSFVLSNRKDFCKNFDEIMTHNLPSINKQKINSSMVRSNNRLANL